MTATVVAQADPGELLGPLAALGLGLILFFLLLVAAIVLTFVGYYKLFQKAGVQGWEALMPYHNLWVHLRIIGRPEKWALAPLVPAAGYLVILPFAVIPILGVIIAVIFGLAMFAYSILLIVLYCTVMLGLAQSFGQTSGFGVGLILLPFVFIPILGFGDARYLGPVGPNPPEPYPTPVGSGFPASGYGGGYQAPAPGWGQVPPGSGYPPAPEPYAQPGQRPQPIQGGDWGGQQPASAPQWGQPPPQWGQPPGAQGGPDLSKGDNPPPPAS